MVGNPSSGEANTASNNYLRILESRTLGSDWKDYDIKNCKRLVDRFKYQGRSPVHNGIRILASKETIQLATITEQVYCGSSLDYGDNIPRNYYVTENSVLSTPTSSRMGNNWCSRRTEIGKSFVSDSEK